MINFSVIGLAQTVGKFARMEVGAELAAKEISSKAGSSVLERAKANAPVKTGALRDSIREKPDPSDSSAVLVGSEGLPDIRAIATEFGTVNMAAEPWLRPALDEAHSSLLSTVTTLLNRILR